MAAAARCSPRQLKYQIKKEVIANKVNKLSVLSDRTDEEKNPT